MKNQHAVLKWRPRARLIGRSRRGLVSILAFTLMLTSGFAFGPASGNAASACSDMANGPTTRETTDQAPPLSAPVARLATASELHRDWPVVSETEQTKIDDHGRSYKTTVTMYEAPAPAPPQKTSALGIVLGPGIALACSATLGDIAPLMTAYSYDGAFQQHYQLYFHRWLDNTGQFTLYQNYQTNVWWTRNYTSYDIYNNQTQNCWNMPQGFDCNDNPQYRDPLCSLLPFQQVGWPGGTGDSYTYVYAGPMNTWSPNYRTSASGTFNWGFPMTTQVSDFGTYIDTISDSYTTPMP